MSSHKCHWAVHRSDAVVYQCEVEYNATGGVANMRHLKSHEKKDKQILNKQTIVKFLKL